MNEAGVGEFTAFVNFSQELSMCKLVSYNYTVDPRLSGHLRPFLAKSGY